MLAERTRAADTAARYGGEEFVVLMPATDAETAQLVAGRLLAAIAETRWPFRPVTVSCGIVTALPESADAAGIIREADQALYQSKRLGRNRITHVEHADRLAGTTASRPGLVAALQPGIGTSRARAEARFGPSAEGRASGHGVDGSRGASGRAD